MKISCVIGHLHVDTRPLRQALSPITQRAVDDIKASVLDAARREATTTMARYKRRNETLARRKEGLDAGRFGGIRPGYRVRSQGCTGKCCYGRVCRIAR